MNRFEKFKREARTILWITGAVIAGPAFLIALYYSLRKKEKWYQKHVLNNGK